MAEYTVTFTDGSTKTIEARSMRYVEKGLEFQGHKHSQSRSDLVAFVPYAALKMVEGGKGATLGVQVKPKDS
ncbi:hypothetical protein [Streptomyces cylindrosporus]|uniref:Uncharacterized protein n=1 Tax=Streptomyces cylindrosporus TaxID=2927583 RepID=A0ABS9Y1D5_9ACTN|nr:hypothetical protein [Streptomyces cylindrosporus]MCI3271012.1 hypothetical protein [Streptomyces cylindrosporus]